VTSRRGTFRGKEVWRIEEHGKRVQKTGKNRSERGGERGVPRQGGEEVGCGTPNLRKKANILAKKTENGQKLPGKKKRERRER